MTHRFRRANSQLRSRVDIFTFPTAVGGVALVLAACLGSASSQSLRPGMGAIPYSDVLGTGVTFRVWSPHATSVAVRGSFNGWGTTAMAKENASELWSVDVPGAAAGSQYKYFINGSYWWKDPRSRQVTFSGYDTSGANSIVFDPAAFNWLGDSRLGTTQSDLVIYELHVGAFHDPTPASGGPGKFTDALARLDHLAALGVNAVELLPIVEFPGDYSWGYNPADIFAVENSGYGGPDGLKLFVRAAHQRGIRVLLDMVHNHWGPTDLELYGFDIGSASRFYFYTNANICCTPWGGRPNYASSGVRSFIIDNFKLWLDEYHVDGFRWDAVGAMRHYDPGYVSIPEADSLIQYINATVIHAEHPGAISIAEDDSGGINFDGEWARGFGDTLINEMVKATDSSRDMNAMFGVMDGGGFFRVLFSETHDLVGNLNGPGAQRLPKRIDPAAPDSYFARKRSMLAAAVLMAAPGTPMLFMGQEMLTPEQFADNQPLNWSRTNAYSRVLKFYRDLIHLRRNLDGVSLGLTGPNITWHAVDNSAKVLAFHRWGAGADDQVMVVMNFSNTNRTNYTITGFPADGLWFVNLNSDWTNYGADFGNTGGSLVTVTGGTGQVTIGPYSVLLLSRRAHPELDADGDGLRNGWEQQYFGDPIVAVATADNDGDGANNLQEQTADTDPHSAVSVLKFTGIETSGANLTLRWTGGQNTRQIVQQAPSLGGAWIGIFTNPPPTAISNNLIVLNLPGEARYYRIQTAP